LRAFGEANNAEAEGACGRFNTVVGLMVVVDNSVRGVGQWAVGSGQWVVDGGWWMVDVRGVCSW